MKLKFAAVDKRGGTALEEALKARNVIGWKGGDSRPCNSEQC